MHCIFVTVYHLLARVTPASVSSCIEIPESHTHTHTNAHILMALFLMSLSTAFHEMTFVGTIPHSVLLHKRNYHERKADHPQSVKLTARRTPFSRRHEPSADRRGGAQITEIKVRANFVVSARKGRMGNVDGYR